MAAIKGLAWSLNKPVAGVSSLDILAKNVRDCDSLVIPAVDAKRGLIYGSAYRFKNGVLKRIMPYMLLDPHNFINKVKTKIGSGSRMDVVILGDALSLYKEEFRQQMPNVKILDKDYWSVRAGNIIELALELIRKKDLASSFELRPIYLYPRDCQIKKREV
jgi:tRNA threonylcarbamoyladenosine biosynthesis protein TsaB